MEWINSNPDVYRRTVTDKYGEWDVIYSALEELVIGPPDLDLDTAIKIAPDRNLRIYADQVRVIGKVESRGHGNTGGRIEIVARTIIAGTEDACLSVQPEDGPVGPFKKAPNTNQQNADFSQWPGGLTGLLATRPQPPAEQFGRFTRLRSRQPQLWLDGSNFQLTDESLFSAVGKWGCDGEPGGEPQPGAAGGQILLRLDSLPKKNPTGFILTLSAKGGTGGRGHDGQNGAPGEPGSDVYLKGIVRGKVLKAAPVREFLDAAGRIPGKSGNGGDAGVSGQGGRGGSVNVSIRDWSGSNLDHLIRICIDPREPGPSGTPGQPGTTEPDHFARFVKNISFVYREWVEYLKYLGTPVDYSLTQRLQSFFPAHTRAGTLPRPEPGKPGATEMASGAHTPTYVADYFPTTLLDKLYQRARLQVLMADPLGGDEEALSGVALTRATDTLHWLTSVLEPIKDRKDAKYIRHVLLYHEANALYSDVLTGAGPYGIRSNYVPRQSIDQCLAELTAMTDLYKPAFSI